MIPSCLTWPSPTFDSGVGNRRHQVDTSGWIPLIPGDARTVLRTWAWVCVFWLERQSSSSAHSSEHATLLTTSTAERRPPKEKSNRRLESKTAWFACWTIDHESILSDFDSPFRPGRFSFSLLQTPPKTQWNAIRCDNKLDAEWLHPQEQSPRDKRNPERFTQASTLTRCTGNDKQAID